MLVLIGELQSSWAFCFELAAEFKKQVSESTQVRQVCRVSKISGVQRWASTASTVAHQQSTFVVCQATKFMTMTKRLVSSMKRTAATAFCLEPLTLVLVSLFLIAQRPSFHFEYALS